MKYRIQFSAVYDNANANAILNEIEGVKTKVFAPTGFTQVEIIRNTVKKEYKEDFTEDNIYSSIDFDAVEDTHNSSDGDSQIDLDVSFDDEQDYFDCINYLESIKGLADDTKLRQCRHYECNHDEIPLVADGSPTLMLFDASPLTFS